MKKFVYSIGNQNQDLRITARNCRALVKAAREEASALHSAAAAATSALEAKAAERGYAAGCQEASAIIQSAERLARDIVSRSSTMVLEIALAVAEQVIGEAIEQQRGAIEKRVLRALDYAQNAGSLHITCAPADSMFLRKCLADWSAERRMITLNEDDSLGPGSFRIDTGLGVIEGFPGKHFQAISNCLNGAKDAADAWFGEQGAAAQ